MKFTATAFGYVVGGVYLLVGVFGFVVTGFEEFTTVHGDLLLIFEVNPAHNLLHALLGMALVAAAGADEVTARQVTLLVGLGYLVLGVLGFFIAGDPQYDVLALNLADHILHLATAVAALAVVALSKRTVAEVPH